MSTALALFLLCLIALAADLVLGMVIGKLLKHNSQYYPEVEDDRA